MGDLRHSDICRAKVVFPEQLAPDIPISMLVRLPIASPDRLKQAFQDELRISIEKVSGEVTPIPEHGLRPGDISLI